MYIARFVQTRNSFNNLTLINRYFASKSHTNKVSLYFQRAKLIDSIRLSLRSNDSRYLLTLLKHPALDSVVVKNALQSAPSPESALLLIETLKNVPSFAHNQSTLYALAKILARSQQTARLKALIGAINSGQFPNVAHVSFMDQMRWYALVGDLDLVLGAWDKWRDLQKRTNTESYNIVMSIYAHMGKNCEAVKTFYMMIAEGVVPNSRTYTVVIEHLLKTGKLDSALQIFNILPSMRIKQTVKQYSLLVEASTSSKQFDIVRCLLNEMRINEILPSRAMQQSLQQMQEAGFLEETEEYIKEMLPDERIKKIGVYMDDCDDEIDDNDVNDNCIDEVGNKEVKLKPWLDPAALASALHNWGPEEVSALEEAKIIWTTRLVCKMIRNFSSAETAWKIFSWVSHQPGFKHDVYTVSRMISKLAHHGHVDLVDQLLSQMKRESIKLSISTIRSIIDSYGVLGNGYAALRVFCDVKTLYEPISKTSMLLLYASILRTLAKCKMNTDVLETLDEMILSGIIPDIQTFTGLMHHFAVEGDMKTVQRLFGMVRQSGLKPDAYMFKVLIRAYCKCERASLAFRVFEDMMDSNLIPDAATKQLLVKSLWYEGKLREAAAVEERSGDIKTDPQLILHGHLYRISSVDLTWVCNIYSNSFTTTIGLDK